MHSNKERIKNNYAIMLINIKGEIVMKNKQFTKTVEKLVNPIEAGTISFFAPFNKFLPKKLQKHIVESAAKKTPYMGFIVDPYSYFLCYEIKDLTAAKKLLPSHFRLVKTAIFAEDTPKYYGILGCFNVRASAFYGQRLEFYLIAENTQTGLLSWVIVDYDSNTISYDERGSLVMPSCETSIITTDYNGHVIVDMTQKNNARRLAFTSDIKNAMLQPLDERLWVEGNLSVAYGQTISQDSTNTFGLIFNPAEMTQALNIPLENLTLEENTWYSELINTLPDKILCFPYAQHFLADSPGLRNNIKDKKQLLAIMQKLQTQPLKAYSAEGMRRTLGIFSFFPYLIILILILFLIFK